MNEEQGECSKIVDFGWSDLHFATRVIVFRPRVVPFSAGEQGQVHTSRSVGRWLDFDNTGSLDLSPV